MTSVAGADPFAVPTTPEALTARAERRLHESEERFRLAFEHAPIAKALIGLDGRFESVNPAMCRFTGYSEQELLQLTVADLTHPADLDMDESAMASLLTGRVHGYGRSHP